MITFGTGGFRGVIGDDFTRQNVQRIAQGLCEVAAEHGWTDKPVVIGYDRRFMSDYFAQWMAEVFAGNRVRVLLCTGSVPTPLVMSATKALENELGVMITASHNPYTFNGVKVFRKSGMDADVAFTNLLERVTNACKTPRIMPLAAARAAGLVQDFTGLKEYLGSIEAFIDPEIRDNTARILFDNMCGVGVVGLKPLAKRFRIQRFDIVNANHDAFFNFIPPNPTELAMSHLRGLVLEQGYDYAIATDSDGDRLGVLDEAGNSVGNNDILACLYYYLVRCRGERGDVVKNCSTSILLDKLAAKLGFACHEVDVGFKNISAKMKQTDALIGGESSGGLTVRNYIFGKDSIFSASLFMEMQIRMRQPVSQIVRQVRAFAGYSHVFSEESVEVSDMSVFDALVRGSGEFLGASRAQAFGRNVKYYFGDGSWALVRASGTEPLLRIVAEMPTRRETRHTIELMKRQIRALDGAVVKECI